MSTGVINGAAILRGAINGIPQIYASGAATQDAETLASAGFLPIVGGVDTTPAQTLLAIGAITSAISDHLVTDSLVAHAYAGSLSRHATTNSLVRHP